MKGLIYSETLSLLEILNFLQVRNPGLKHKISDSVAYWNNLVA